ncbi:MAG: BatA domain-containing protein [Woeseiaceae bacterium]
MMSLLAPLFLLGTLAVALPFWLHRLHTQSSNREPFSSAMLLETTDERVHVQKKLKYYMLLALRVLLLVLLALAFAKPLWTSPEGLPGNDPDGTHLVLVDTSASMNRSGTFEQALDDARQAIGSAPGGALLQVLSAARDVREASALTTDRDVAAGALQGLDPGTARLDFGDAMATIDRLAEDLPSPVTLHVTSDFQDSGLPVRFADLVSSQISSLQVHPTGTQRSNNWSIDAIRVTADGIDVVVTATGDDVADAVVTATVNGSQADRREISSGDFGTVSFTELPLEQGDNRVQVEIDANDDLALDNIRYHVIRKEPPTPIPLLTLDIAGLPVTYLSAALLSDPRSNYEVEAAVIGSFDTRTLSRYRWVVVDDIGAVDARLESALDEFVRNGGGLLAFTGRRSASSNRLPLLGNDIRGASLTPNEYGFLVIGQVESGHPLLAATDGWYDVNFSETIPLVAADNDEVLVRLENGEPFIIERHIGQGRVLLVAGDLQNRGNDLPTRPVFVSFVIEAARYLSGSEQVVRSFTAGSLLPLSVVAGASGQVIDPQGNSLLSLAATTRAQQIQLDQTGFYEVYNSQGSYTIAVNVDPRESRLTTMPAETLQRWVAAMSGPDDASVAPELELQAEPVELWHALLFILLLVLVGESILGNWYLAPATRSGVNG